MNRREFFQGKAAGEEHIGYVSSAIVTAQPQNLDRLRARLHLMSGVEVVASRNHKIVLLLEASGRDVVGSLLTQISLLEGVLSANFVFEGSYENDEDAA